MKTAQSILSRITLTLLALFSVASLQAEQTATFKVGEITFARPDKWEWMGVTSPMRKAQFKVKSMDGKAVGEVVFFHFGPGNGGGTQGNVDRWLGQFEEPREKINAKVEDITVGKTKVTYVQAEGTYKSGMPGQATTPMPDYALLGAVIEAKEGNVFVKLTGPKGLVESSTVEFKKMVESALQ